MCDDHYADDLKEFERRGDITRRHFGKLTLGTGPRRAAACGG
ncbi:MAG: hypothetical protein U1F30_16355 [Steroidobacteraceae bacterium]